LSAVSRASFSGGYARRTPSAPGRGHALLVLRRVGCTQPVQVFHGQEDEILDHEMGQRLADRTPDSTFNTIDGGHYTVFADWPEFPTATK
jgi:pimeloyl-ACP methyl ester carboxylesterase